MTHEGASRSPLLFLAYYYPPINAVGGLRADRFARFLRESGYPVRVISSDLAPPSANTENVHFVPSSPPSPGIRLASLAGRVIHKVLQSYSDHLDWTPHAIAGAKPWIQPGTILFSSSPPIANHLAALQLKQKFGLKWIADFRDPFADSPFRTAPLLRRFDRRLERAIFRSADAITTVTDILAREWKHRFPDRAKDIHCVWNGFDPDEPFGPAPAPPRPYRLMAHVGDLYGSRHPGRLLASISRWVTAGRIDPATVRLDLIGPLENPEFRALPAFQQLVGLGVVQFNNQRVPRAEAMQAIAEAEYLLLLDLNSQNIGHTVPAKLFDYLRTGHPILTYTSRNSVVDSILSQAGVPYTSVFADDPDSVADEKALAFLQLPVTPVLPNNWFWDNFDGRRQTQALVQVIESLRGR